MGCSCVIGNKEPDLNTERLNELSQKFKSSPKLLKHIVTIQSKLRGMFLRNQIKNETYSKDLEGAINRQKKEAENHLELEIAKLEKENLKNLDEYKHRISELENKLSNTNKDIDLAKYQVQQEKEKEIKELTTKLSEKESIIREREGEISLLKDMKAKLSTKMVGESLEQFCKNEFERVRMLFPVENIYFEKDNDAKSGSKGDFILREQTNNGAELYSIMFEMKNENSETATKHKNEDFFKELDKDRNEKKCEYAVLVSLLELDSDLYNCGIVDVSHRYKKMYVIRPQSFISFITLIRNAALKSAEYIDKLELVKKQEIDITEFEEKMNIFKEGFNKNVSIAKNSFEEAIRRIDEAIKDLNKTKEELERSARNLSQADKKLEDINIKKLSKGNPTISKLLEGKN